MRRHRGRTRRGQDVGPDRQGADGRGERLPAHRRRRTAGSPSPSARRPDRMIPNMSTNAPTPARQPPPGLHRDRGTEHREATSASQVGHRWAAAGRRPGRSPRSSCRARRAPGRRRSGSRREPVEVGAVGLHRADLDERRVVGRGVLERDRAAGEVEVGGARGSTSWTPRRTAVLDTAGVRTGGEHDLGQVEAEVDDLHRRVLLARAGVRGDVLVDRAAQAGTGVADVVLCEVADARPGVGARAAGRRGGTARPSDHGASRSCPSPDVRWTLPMTGQ